MSSEMLTTPTSSRDLTSYSIDDMNKNFKHLNNSIISIARTLGTMNSNISEDKQKNSENYNNVIQSISENKHVVDIEINNVNQTLQNFNETFININSKINSFNTDIESLSNGLNALSDNITNLNVDGKIEYLDNKISVLEKVLEKNMEHNKLLLETNSNLLNILNYMSETNNTAFLAFDKKINEFSLQQTAIQQNNCNLEMMLMSLENNLNMLFVDNKKNSSKLEFIIEKLNNMELKMADYADKVEKDNQNNNELSHELSDLNDDNQIFSSNLLKSLNIIRTDENTELTLENGINLENELNNLLMESNSNNNLNENSNTNNSNENSNDNDFLNSNNTNENSNENENSNANNLQNNNTMLLLERLSAIYESADKESDTRSRVVPDVDSNILKYAETTIPEHNLDTEKIDINDFKLCNILIPPEDRFKADDETIKLPQPKKKRGRKTAS